MSLSPVFWSSQHIYWRSILCRSGVEEKGEQRQDDISSVCESNTQSSSWDKDNWQSHLVSPSSFHQQQPCKNRLPVVFFPVSLTAGWLIQCPWGSSISCLLFFADERFDYNTNTVFNNTVHKCRISFFFFLTRELSNIFQMQEGRQNYTQ